MSDSVQMHGGCSCISVFILNAHKKQRGHAAIVTCSCSNSLACEALQRAGVFYACSTYIVDPSLVSPEHSFLLGFPCLFSCRCTSFAPTQLKSLKSATHFFGYRALEHSHELLRVTWERVEELLE